MYVFFSFLQFFEIATKNLFLIIFSYLEPAIRADFAFLGEALAVARCDDAEVRVLDHLCNTGLGCCQIFSKVLELPSQTEQ